MSTIVHLITSMTKLLTSNAKAKGSKQLDHDWLRKKGSEQAVFFFKDGSETNTVQAFFYNLCGPSILKGLTCIDEQLNS